MRIEIDPRETEVVQNVRSDLGLYWHGHPIRHPAMRTGVEPAAPRSEAVEHMLTTLRQMGALMLRREIADMSNHDWLVFGQRRRAHVGGSPQVAPPPD